MSMVKANLMPNLEALALYPFKSLFIQRKNDHYMQTTKQYSDRLRQLYRSKANARLQELNQHRSKIESDTFRLDSSNQSKDSLNGLTIARSSFPTAQQNELIVLVKATEKPDDLQPVIGRGIIQAVTEKEIKIKLSKPLLLGPDEEEKEDQHIEWDQSQQSTSVKSSESGEIKPIGEHEAKKVDEDKSGLSKDAAEIEVVENASEATRMIDFKIRYDLKAAKSSFRSVDEFGLLVMDVLAKFDKHKCDPAIQKNLLGFYDERDDHKQEVVRIMLFDELHKPKGQQKLAIEQAIKRRVSLIEGPAGSGKTLVAAHIAANISRLKRTKVLVCSPIQANVDRLAELIAKIDGIQVVKLPDRPLKLSLPELLGQVPARKRNQVKSGTESSHCYLNKLVDDEIYLNAWNRSKDTLRNHQDSLHAHAYRMVTSCSEHRRRQIEAKILAKSDVVCCTNKQAGSYLLNECQFGVLILDDVQATSELDCLIPIMVKGIKQLVLLSDSRKRIRLARTLKRTQSNVQTASHDSEQIVSVEGSDKPNGIRTDRNSLKRRSYRQTKHSMAQANGTSQPVDSSTRGGGSSLQPSLEPGGLFERLLALGLPTVDLRVQFRLHKTLSNFTNHHFYLGRLKDDPATNDKLTADIEASLLMGDEKRFSWLPNRKFLTAIFNVKSHDGASCSSQVNPGNDLLIQMIEKLDDLTSKLLFNEDIQTSRIGIIFNRRVDKQADWAKKIPENIKVGTIADFIGQERDFITLIALPDDYICSVKGDSLTQARLTNCSEIQCDFKHDDGALNCALTRARLGLFLIAADITVETDGGLQANSTVPKEHANHSAAIHGCKSWTDLVHYYKASSLLV